MNRPVSMLNRLACCLVMAMGVGLFAGNLQAAIAQRGTATTATVTTGTSLTVNKPSGVVAGDVMNASIAQYAGGAGSAAGLSGWTAVTNGSLGGSTSRYGTLLYKVAGAAEPSSYTFTLTPSVSGAVGDIVAFSGVDNASPLDVPVAGFTSSTTSNITATAITTVTPGAAAIMFGLTASMASSTTGATWNNSGWSAGLTEIFDSQGSGTGTSATSIGAAWKTLIAAGTTGAGAAVTSTNMQRGAGVWVALRAQANAANAANSTVAAAPASVAADGVTASTVTVTLKDSGGAAVWGKTVSLISSRGAADAVSPGSGASGVNGVIAFTVRSATPGSSVFTATNATDGLTVNQTASVNFLAGTNKDFLVFGANYLGSSAVINPGAATVAWTVPNGSTVSSLSPAYVLSTSATGSPVSGSVLDFTTPQNYTLTAQDGSTRIYTVAVTVAPPSPAKDILAFGTNYAGSSAVINTNAGTIAWTLAAGWPLTGLSPVYTISLFASGAPASGTTRDFTSPQIYAITAQDGSSKNYTVTASNAIGAQTYGISLDTDLAQEFSPMNRSGHPIMTGLTNYPNSLAPKALGTNAMKAPWIVNVGSQTMLCSDCHDATTTNYNPAAAQGPHGSAGQYMLRGPNGNNWPAVTLANISQSWCANCHNSSNAAHSEGNHSGFFCYQCHIVVPHGGKVSRLMATRGSSLPARYAWQNNTNNVSISVFRKAATYGQNGYCNASCYHGNAVTVNPENW